MTPEADVTCPDCGEALGKVREEGFARDGTPLTLDWWKERTIEVHRSLRHADAAPVAEEWVDDDEADLP